MSATPAEMDWSCFGWLLLSAVLASSCLSPLPHAFSWCGGTHHVGVVVTKLRTGNFFSPRGQDTLRNNNKKKNSIHNKTPKQDCDCEEIA